MPSPGKRFGPYEVEELLSRSAETEVLKTRRPGTRGWFALKALRAGVSSRVRERFLKEAELSLSLESPFLVRAVDACLDGERPWLAMELLEGWTLETLMANARPRLLRIVPRLCTSLLQALVALEGVGLTHRDVSPSNVLVSPGDEVRLIDMGLLDRPVAGIAGTPAYLSPEALRGERVGSPGDLYQAGALLYEVLSEYVPHEDLSPSFLQLRRDRDCRPTDLQSLAPGTSTAVSRLVASMLEPDPAARPSLQEALELARAIPAPWFHQPPVAQLFDHRDRSLDRGRRARVRRRAAAGDLLAPARAGALPVGPAREQLVRLFVVLGLGLLAATVFGVAGVW